jgi:nicotinate-nucleotide--dimethylbenzimidazole phosphoribosyltransferase
VKAARDRLAALAKPPGSLGRLEDLAVQLAAIAGRCPPPMPAPGAVAVFAGDHGVLAQGVTSWPASVTAAMVRTMAAGRASVNALAAQVGATVTVVDVGVAEDLDGVEGVRHAKVRPGTRDLAVEPALTPEEVDQAIDVGRGLASELVADGARYLVTGDMGIGNTTPSAALVAAVTGADPAEVTGRGTGIDDQTLARKVAAVRSGVERLAGRSDPRSALCEVGGLEIAALTGFVLGGARAGVPVVVDGLITLAALLVAEGLVPGVRHRCIAGHRPTEPGATRALDHLGLRPLLDLELRLGEGSGGLLAVPLLQAAARLLRDVATIDEALG